MNSTLFTQEDSPVLKLGVGALGCTAARLGAEHCDELCGAGWSAAHFNGAELIATGLEKKIFLKIPDGPFAVRHAVRAAEAQRGALEALVRGREAVVLCGCLGETFTGEMLSALSAAVGSCGVPVFVLALEPFALLEKLSLNAFENRAEKVAGSAQMLALLSAGMDKVTAGISARRIERMAAERLMAAAECFAAALAARMTGGQHLRTLRGTHRAELACASGPALSVFELAFAALDEVRQGQLAAVCIQSAEELSLREARALLAKLPERTRLSAALCTAIKPAYAEQSACLLLSSERRSAGNVVSIEAGFSSTLQLAD